MKGTKILLSNLSLKQIHWGSMLICSCAAGFQIDPDTIQLLKINNIAKFLRLSVKYITDRVS